MAASIAEGSRQLVLGSESTKTAVALAVQMASAVAKTEFQAVQMMPLVIIPQLLLAGLFVNRTDMPTALTYVSDVLPVSYSIYAVNSILAGDGNGIWAPVAILAAFIAGALVLGSLTLRRRTT